MANNRYAPLSDKKKFQGETSYNYVHLCTRITCSSCISALTIAAPVMQNANSKKLLSTYLPFWLS